MKCFVKSYFNKAGGRVERAWWMFCDQEGTRKLRRDGSVGKHNTNKVKS